MVIDILRQQVRKDFKDHPKRILQPHILEFLGLVDTSKFARNMLSFVASSILVLNHSRQQWN